MEIYPRKLEAVKLIKECGVSYVQAARDLGVNRSVLRNWVKGFEADPPQRLRATVR
jgi:transposase-like protein